MKAEKRILFAFVLNLSFAVFELFGGVFTGSVAIVSDAVHDLGDAVSIGLACLLERISKKPPNAKYTYGYTRYSVVGSLVTTLVLLLGSVAVIGNALGRILEPAEIRSEGMILFAVVGVCINLGAALLTGGGTHLNQKTVNLHMLEDVLGWIVVLVGALVIQWTGFYLIDPLMSIGVAGFILIQGIKNGKEILGIFLEKTPDGVCIEELRARLCEIDGVRDVHHIHVWSMDGQRHCATMHVVVRDGAADVKLRICCRLRAFGIVHETLELEGEKEGCRETECIAFLEACAKQGHRHHHCHHHHHK